ncbi:hypothetical protein LCGC14_0515550 [marine sediment metagenome]|uniref:Uncharacterized protein n=1 Tax=marine sediment metagenome TaxID=412755 RepID=A0A0F9S005_9ZZZZ|nr:hypothetical protein [bacterium]
MDTTKSDSIVRNFLHKEAIYLRKVNTFSDTLNATPEQIFPLLCPAREADWIPEWHPELIYTNSGYAEENCVFRTGKSHLLDEGIWTFTGYMPCEYIEFVKIESDIIQHCRIDLVQNSTRTTTITFKITSTSLTQKGNIILENSKNHSDSNQLFKMMKYYLEKGKIISKLN